MTQADTKGSGQALARAALAGNPSDGYGGAVLAVTVAQHRAQAIARPANTPLISPDSALVRATVERFSRELAPHASCTAIRWSTTIPRGVGLGGSSAIVIATLRALCGLYAVSLPEATLAELALAVEVEELGIAAGLQDRVAQSYGGLTFMDFAPGGGTGDPGGRYQRLNPALLPPLVVAWRSDSAGESSEVHAPLQVRYAQGEPAVREALADLARAAHGARAALLTGDHGEFARCVDESFDARRRMLTLDRRHVEMIECARASGAAANYAGSGGAIVAVCRDEDEHRRVTQQLARLGCEAITP